jgi:hypothetical protein
MTTRKPAMQELLTPADDNPLFRRSLETQILTDVLRNLQPGESLSYAELSKIAGVEINGTSYQLRSAREIVMRENGIVAEPIHGIGIKRLRNVEIVNSTSRGVSRITKAAAREARKLSKADFVVLDEATRRSYATYASVIEVVGTITSGKGVARVAANIPATAMELTLAQTMRLFQDRSDDE